MILLGITSMFTIMLHTGITDKENATSKAKDVEYAQYMSREPGGH